MPIIKEERLNRYDPSTFSFKQVKGEVSEAMQEDWKHSKVDDAKKRAIYDSRNYDEFKQRVAGCTLKPIHRNEFNAPPKFAFNRQAQGGSQPTGAAQPTPAGPRVEAKRAVKSGREFERELRRCTSHHERVSMVEQLEESDFPRLFGRELDAEALRQVLVALGEAAPPRTGGHFLLVLATQCPLSTATAASFLSAADREMVERLLAGGGGSPDDVVRACAAFGVRPQIVAAAASAGDEAVESLTAVAKHLPRDEVTEHPTTAAGDEEREGPTTSTVAESLTTVAKHLPGDEVTEEPATAAELPPGDEEREAPTASTAGGPAEVGLCDTLD